MNTARIKARLRDGFKPFVLHTSDGGKFKIPYSGSILVGKSMVAVLRENDLVETLDALHIVSIEDMKQAAA